MVLKLANQNGQLCSNNSLSIELHRQVVRLQTLVSDVETAKGRLF